MNFTLIVCTYMRPTPLLNLLKSVAMQTLYPNEILIIDGSSNNLSKDMIDSNNFKNIKYFKVDQAHRGLTKQRNYGIRNVSDHIDIVCFLDDDIVLTENYFELLLDTYRIQPNALGVGGYIVENITWRKLKPFEKLSKYQFVYDGWVRKDSSRFVFRK